MYDENDGLLINFKQSLATFFQELNSITTRKYLI